MYATEMERYTRWTIRAGKKNLGLTSTVALFRSKDKSILRRQLCLIVFMDRGFGLKISEYDCSTYY
jgi:hypothetical protein